MHLLKYTALMLVAVELIIITAKNHFNLVQYLLDEKRFKV